MLQMPRIGCLLKLTARIYIVCVPFRVLIHLATRPQSVASGSQMQMCIHQYLNPPFAAIGKDSQDRFQCRSTLHPFRPFNNDGPSLTLKEGSEVKFDITKRFTGQDFLQVVLTFKTSKTNIKQVLGPLKMLDPSLTLKEGSKVKFDRMKRFTGHVFLQVDLAFQTSRTNNK